MTIQKIKYTILFFLILFLQRGFAQEENGTISGYIFTPENEPSMYSTAVLMNQDSVFMGGTMSQEDGLFEIGGVKPGNYFVMIRNLEFQTHVSDLISMNPGETVSLGSINLETKTTALQEVVVKGEKSILEVHSDKIVFNVANSISSSGSNGLELLSNSPGVLVDMDKNISLQGKAGVKIYINGRPARLSGTDLSNMLESMRSDNIEKIEIINNPSAKYEAEGAGGIINIVLKKNMASGFNGNVIGSYVRGQLPRSNAGTSLNYSGEKVSVFSTLNYTDNYWFDNFEETNQQGDYLLDMESENINNRRGINASGGLDYTINTENYVSIDGRFLQNRRADETNSTTIISNDAAGFPTQVLVSAVDEESLSKNYNANAHYSFDPNRSTSFSADASYAFYSYESSTIQPNTYFAEDMTEILRSKENQFETQTNIDLFSSKIDYEKKLSKFTFSTGAKYSYVATENELLFYDVSNNEKVINDQRTNDFSYLEKVAAAYFIVDGKLHEKLAVNAGLRVENTSSLGELSSKIETNDNVVARNYTSYFPNIGLTYDDSKIHSIGLSYGRRIGRPNYQYLNPFVSVISEVSAWRGNPFLKPNYINNYQVNYAFKRKLFISNTYSVTTDFFANIFVATDEISSVITPQNMDRVTNNGLSISYPLRVAEWWQFSSFFIYNHEKYDGNMEGAMIDLKADIYSFRMQNNLKLPFDFAMDLTYFYRSPWIWRGTIYVKEFHVLNMGLKREFLDERILVQLTANDILRTSSDYYYNSNYGGMEIEGVRKFDNRRFGINLTYKFGNEKAKSKRRNKSAIDEELNRISG